MAKDKFVRDCEIPFKIDWLCRYGKSKYCGVKMEDGYVLSYVAVPDSIRYGFAPIIRYFKSDDGQDVIKGILAEKDRCAK